jgi:hypothetical protein
MFASSTCAHARGSRFLRRAARLSVRVLRALLVGAAAFGPPRPQPEPPPPQTTSQANDGSAEA